jgi:hypothetical protein
MVSTIPLSYCRFALISGFYFPNTEATFKYYNGTILEEEYEKKLMVRQPPLHIVCTIRIVPSLNTFFLA